MKTKILGYILLSVFLFASCDKSLEKEFYGEFDLISSGDGMNQTTLEALINGVYSSYQFNGVAGRNYIYLGDFTGDHMYNEKGGLSRETSYLRSFTWNSQLPVWLNYHFWTKPYQAIRDANFVLSALETAKVDENIKVKYRAEVRFMRALMYEMMYGMFGTVPLRTSSNDAFNLPRAKEEDLLVFIQTELAEAAAGLPVQADYEGRATKGGAYAVLMKHYLNQKNWAQVEKYSKLIIDLGKYELYTTGDHPYRDLFRVEFEGIEKESIISFTVSPQLAGTASALMSHSYPESDYYSTVDGSDVKLSNQGISGTKNRVYDFFYDSFSATDIRRDLILAEYINNAGERIVLPENKKSPFKYWPDPNMDSWKSGHDFRLVRYADVLLSRAEALNELNGPTQEAIDLINEVRARAKVTGLLLGNYASKSALRDAILDERGWEFFFEGKRREDLIRHGKFISNKQTHPVDPASNAEAWRVLMPIPLEEILANPIVEQNPGY